MPMPMPIVRMAKAAAAEMAAAVMKATMVAIATAANERMLAVRRQLLLDLRPCTAVGLGVL